MASYFLQAKAMQNNFHIFEELVFFDLWIPVSLLTIACTCRTIFCTDFDKAKVHPKTA